MAKKPNLQGLESFFEKGKDFRLTDSEYEKLTGTMLPKNSSYLKNRSALARKAESEGYSIEVIEKTVILKKTK